MERMCKLIGVFVILTLLISKSSQQKEKTEEDKKTEAIFGTLPTNDQPATESPLTPEFLNKLDVIFGTPPPDVTTISSTIPQTDATTPKTSGQSCPAGECVPYFQCLENGVINTNGEELIDIRFGAGPCPDYLEKCCVLQKQMNETDPLSNVETSTNSGTNANAESSTSKSVEKHECGRRNTEGVGFRIIGGEDNEAHYGEFPYMIAVIEEMPSGPDTYVSGGSLIHPSVVLTSAHHFHHRKRNTLKIRAGEWDTKTTKEQFPHQDRIVREIIIHENFYEGGLHNDIALLILQEPVILGDVIDTMCLPPQNFSFDGENNCFASGWGKDSWGKEGKYQVILKKVELPMVPRDQCEQKLRRTRLGQHFILDPSFVCAGGQVGKDTCKGDGGSPLVCPISGKIGFYHQSGIVSFGIGCAGENPGVYANVALYRNWIDQKFAEKGLDTSYYTA